MKKKHRGIRPEAGEMKVELIKDGPDKGRYAVSIDKRKLDGAYTMEEVMALISGREERTAP